MAQRKRAWTGKRFFRELLYTKLQTRFTKLKTGTLLSSLELLFWYLSLRAVKILLNNFVGLLLSFNLTLLITTLKALWGQRSYCQSTVPTGSSGFHLTSTLPQNSLSAVSHTFRPPGVELLHGVVQANPDWGEAHLPVQPRHQTTVKTPWPLSPHHGDNGAQHTPVPHRLAVQRGLGFTLDLKCRTSTAE